VVCFYYTYCLLYERQSSPLKLLKKEIQRQAWWHTSIIPELERLTQEVHEFQASLDYSEILSQKTKEIHTNLVCKSSLAW
jgi:hypothetical protein